MARPPHVLFVEHREKEVELLALELRRGGYGLVQERVDPPEGFADALEPGVGHRPKGRLARLLPAIDRVLRDAALRAEGQGVCSAQ